MSTHTIDVRTGRAATSRPPSAPSAQRNDRIGKSDRRLLWLAAPAVVVFVAFSLIPLAGVLGISLTNWNGVGKITWAGLKNWVTVLHSPDTLPTISATIKIVLLTVVFQCPVSLLLGVFIAGRQRYRAVLAVLYFVPLLMSSSAIALTFISVLDPNFGLGAALPFFAKNWLGDPTLAVIIVVFVFGWQNIPFHTLIYQGGVRQIPESLYEAARIDGANAVQQFFHITLPQLKFTVITSTTLMVVGSLTFFDMIFVLTRGGPGNATNVLPVRMYTTGFEAGNMGVAAVFGVLLAILGLGISLGIQRMGGRDRQASQLEGM